MSSVQMPLCALQASVTKEASVYGPRRGGTARIKRPHRLRAVSVVYRVLHTARARFTAWRRLQNTRAALASLDDHILNDIGLSGDATALRQSVRQRLRGRIEV